MKGYRTFVFAAATILLGLLGKHVAPELINTYLDVIFAGIGVAIVGLRMVTTTPFGQTVLHDLGVSEAEAFDLSHLVASLAPGDKDTLNSAVSGLQVAVSALTGHPLLQPDTATALSSLASLLPNLTQLAQADPVPAKASPEPEPVVSASAAAPLTATGSAPAPLTQETVHA